MTIPRIVYALKHNPTGKVYVGSTESPKRRIAGHIGSLARGSHSNKAMQEDYDRFGCDYSVFILDTIDSFADRNKEFYWMDILSTRDPERGYNQKDASNTRSLSRFKEYHLKNGKPDDDGLASFSEDANDMLEQIVLNAYE